MRFWRNALHFTPAERRGLYCLLGLVILVWALYFTLDYWLEPPALTWELNDSASAAQRKAGPGAALRQSFDPNTVDAETLIAMGLPDWLAQRVLKYRQAGGRFRGKEDLLRIYGMDSAWYREVAAYIRLSPRPDKAHSSPQKKEIPALKPRYFDPNNAAGKELLAMGLSEREVRGIVGYREKYRPFRAPDELFAVYNLDSARASALIPYVRLDSVPHLPKGKKTAAKKREKVNLNEADSLSLLAVKGIGPYSASVLLKQRRALGAFHSLGQLEGTFPFDSVRLGQLAEQLYCAGPIPRYDLNRIPLDSLEAHPYISKELARNIDFFRREVRPFESVTELANIELVDPVLLRKIAPYFYVQKVREKRK